MSVLAKRDYAVKNCTNCYAFGMAMEGRGKNPISGGSEYRFGFNGQEKTDEISGVGNHLDFKYRGYDPRTGRFWSVDPLFKDYPWNSTYAFAENDVIRAKDLEGAEKYIVTTMVHPNGVKVTTTTENDVAGILGNGTLYRLIDIPKGALGASYTENGKSYEIPFNYAFPEFNMKSLDEGSIKQGYTTTEKIVNGAKKMWKAMNEDGGANLDPGTDQTPTKQDWVVAGGVIGTMSGVGAMLELGIAGATVTKFIPPALSTLNSADDVLTNSKGESGLQRMFNSKESKNAIGDIKGGIGILGVGTGVSKIKETARYTFGTLSTATDAVSSGKFIKQKAEELKTTE